MFLIKIISGSWLKECHIIIHAKTEICLIRIFILFYFSFVTCDFFLTSFTGSRLTDSMLSIGDTFAPQVWRRAGHLKLLMLYGKTLLYYLILFRCYTERLIGGINKLMHYDFFHTLVVWNLLPRYKNFRMKFELIRIKEIVIADWIFTKMTELLNTQYLFSLKSSSRFYYNVSHNFMFAFLD